MSEQKRKQETKDNTDPVYVGPGIWYVIHKTAFEARTRKKQLMAISLIKEICTNFPCHTCREHCTKYIKNHPLDEYIDITIRIENEKLPLGIFVWTWKFHNSVNKRLKKPIINWDTAYNLYLGNGNLVCSKNCMSPDDQVPDEVDYKNNIPWTNTNDIHGFKMVSYKFK